MRPMELACRGRRFELARAELPLDLDRLVPLPDDVDEAPWEVEIGFGKGRFILARAAEEPAVRLLGIEMASRYFALAEKRMR